MSKARDIADLDFNSPDIDGGNIDGATIGGTTPAAGSFTTGQFNTSINVDGVAKVDALTVDAGTGTDAVAKLRMGAGNSGLNKSSLNFENSAGSEIFAIDYINSGTTLDINSDIGGSILTFTRAGGIVINSDNADHDVRIASDTNQNMLFVDGGNNRVGVGGVPSYPLHQQVPNGTEEEIPFRVDGYKTGVQKIWLNNKRAPYTTNGRGTQLIFGNNGTIGGYIGAIGYGSGGNGELAMGIQRTGGAGTLQTVLVANSNTDATVLRAVGSASASIDLQSADGGFSLLKLNTTEAVFNEGGANIDFRVESNGNTHALFVDAGTSRIGINESSPEAPLHVSGDAIIEGFIKKDKGPTQSSPSFSSGDWVTLATVDYGRVLGEVGVYWNGLSAPSSAHHGYQRLKVGAFYNSYYYGWETTLEHLDHQSHNSFYFNEFRIIRPDGYTNGTPQLLQGKVSANVTAGQFVVYIENQLGPNGDDITPVLPAVDNTPNGNTVQASLTIPARGAKAIYGAFSANGIIYSEASTPEFYLRDTSSGGTASLQLDGTELTLRNNSTNGALKLETNNPREEFVYINGTAFYSESFNMLNNTQYDFDIDVPSEGGFGNSFFIIAGYNHYHATAYSAHKVAFMSSRGTLTGTMIDVGNQQSTGGGAWQFSKANNTTLRIRKTAGTYVGSGSGFITVFFRNKVGN